MPSGGSRNRSGPAADPTSGRSDRRGFKLTALPSEGYREDPPEFPLPRMIRRRWEFEDKRRFQVVDEESTEEYRDREVSVWEEIWSTPQACAWSMQPWRWSVIAEFCRLKTVMEGEPDANASLVSQLHRYRDQIGLTPAGMRENGWSIAADEVAARRPEPASEPARGVPARRLRAVAGE